MKYTLIILSLLVISCDLFKTRNPEQPSDNNVIFIPPTEPQILISNLKNSIENLNSENYIKCLSNDNNNPFIFFPSQSINSSLFSIFKNWNINDERRFINTLNSISNSNKPQLTWINNKSIIENPDSAIYESGYLLNINVNDKNISGNYSGNLRLILITDKQGYWYISRWYDFSNTLDSNNNWSFLKAKLSN